MKFLHESVDSYYFIIFFICLYTLYILSVLRCKTNYIKFLESHSNVYNFFKKYKLTNYGIDIWSFIHFIFYGSVGYFYPNTLLLTMFLGIVWELFEFYIGINKPTIFRNIGFCKTDNGAEKVWWYGKISDIFFNYFGFITGKMLKLY